MLVYVGTFTGQTRAQGISVYRLNQENGALSHLQTVSGLHSPSFLAFHPHQPLLYAVERQWSADAPSPGAVSAFAIQPDGTLRQVNRVQSGGTSPAYVSVHPSGRAVFAAHYVSGQVSAFPVAEDGRLRDASDVVQHEGCGPDPRRQDRPHAHFITPDPSGTFVLSCDLGIDKVLIYRVDLEAGKLAPNAVPYGQVPSGEGPRHLAFHPSGRLAYVINEIGSTISAFAWDAERGALTHHQTLSTLPADFQGTSHTAQIVVHPNGRFIYGSNRGHDSIAIFGIDEQTGKLTPLGHESTQGQTPRNFNIDPSGSLLLAGNERSDTIVAFHIDPRSGALTPTGQVTESPSPVCILFRKEQE